MTKKTRNKVGLAPRLLTDNGSKSYLELAPLYLQSASAAARPAASTSLPPLPNNSNAQGGEAAAWTAAANDVTAV
jgi:hypothetical protein